MFFFCFFIREKIAFPFLNGAVLAHALPVKIHKVLVPRFFKLMPRIAFRAHLIRSKNLIVFSARHFKGKSGHDSSRGIHARARCPGYFVTVRRTENLYKMNFAFWKIPFQFPADCCPENHITHGFKHHKHDFHTTTSAGIEADFFLSYIVMTPFKNERAMFCHVILRTHSRFAFARSEASPRLSKGVAHGRAQIFNKHLAPFVVKGM
jgi:hypothetical protein